MKQALDCYEQLKDAFEYAASSWLRMDLAQGTRADAINIVGAASYLFDNLFAHEDAGKDITRIVYDDLLEQYNPSHLSSKATAIRLNMSKEAFTKGGTPFRDYYNWLLPEEPDLAFALEDEAGLLCFATIDALVSLLAQDNKEAAPLRISEIIFLNVTRTFERIFRAHFGPAFQSLRSSAYFISVEEQFERIRASIEE